MILKVAKGRRGIDDQIGKTGTVKPCSLLGLFYKADCPLRKQCANYIKARAFLVIAYQLL